MAGVFETIYQKLTGKAISHRPDLANRVHVYSEYSDSKAQPADQADDYYEIYGTYVWARKAISKIAENVRSLPIYVYDRNNEAMEGHLLSQLLQRGNDAMSPSQFWEQYVIYLMLAGEAPIEIVPDGRNRPSEMWLREPQWMYVRPDVSPERIYYPTVAGYVYRPEGKHTDPLEFEPGMVIFDKLFNPSNPWRGIAPIHAVREGIVIDLFAQAYSKTFLRNNARPDFAIVAKQLLTDGERDRIGAEFLQRHSGAENWHRPAILDDGAEIAPFSFAPKDTEWLQQRSFSRDEVGAIFGVPDEIMGYGKDTYENFQTALETFWTLTLKPLCDHRDDVLNHHFRYRMPLLKPGEYIATDFSDVGVMQEDLTPRVAMAEVLTRMGYDLNAVNERFDLGMPEYTPPAPEPAPVIEQPQVVEVMPKAAVYLPAPVRDAVRGEVNKALEIRQKLLAAGTFDELRWRENAVKALRTWLDASMAVRLADAIATRADVDALLSVAISASQEDGAAEDSPFGEMLITAGRITPGLWRAAKNTLMLDPEDPEAEQLARMAIERRATREMTRSLEEWLQTALTGLTEDEVRTLASRLRNNQMLFRDVLQRALVQSADLGVSVAVDQFDTVGYGFDYTLANAEARDWARRYTDDLLAQLNTTNERIVGEAVARWVDNGEPLSSLVDDLIPSFGRQRAELIASTEVTRAYAEANRIAYEQSGVVETLEWRTANDERVCPICGPLGGIAAENVGTEQPKLGGGGNVQTSVRNPQFQHPTNGNVYGLPPSHPRCRCWVVPVIKD